jgi:peptide/nickel transport system permease protein
MNLTAIARAILRDRLALAGLVVLLVFVFVGFFGSHLAPYGPSEIVRNAEGRVQVLKPPTWAFPFGTTDLGRDVLSQILHGARPVMIVGFFAAIIPTAIGTVLGLVAGYVRRWADTLISRAVEIAYSLPFEPFAIILLFVLGPSLWTLILAISIIDWRRPARVVRNQVMTLSGGSFIKAARVAGASTSWIVFRHMLPLTLPISLIYVPFAFGNAVLAESALSFLGFGDPKSVSWGTILRQAFDGGAMDRGWWWMVAPGVSITLAVTSVYLITRPFEELVNPRLRRSQ